MKLYVTNIPLGEPIPVENTCGLSQQRIYAVLGLYENALCNRAEVYPMSIYACIDSCVKYIRKARVVEVITADTVFEAVSAYEAKHGALRHAAFMRRPSGDFAGDCIEPYLLNQYPYDVLLSYAVTHACTGTAVRLSGLVYTEVGSYGLSSSPTWVKTTRWGTLPEQFWREVSVAGILTYIAKAMPLKYALDVMRFIVCTLGFVDTLDIFKEQPVLQYKHSMHTLLQDIASVQVCRALRKSVYKRSRTCCCNSIRLAPFTYPVMLIISISPCYSVLRCGVNMQTPWRMSVEADNALLFNIFQCHTSQLSYADLIQVCKRFDSALYEFKRSRSCVTSIRSDAYPLVGPILFTKNDIVAMFKGTDADENVARLLARLS